MSKSLSRRLYLIGLVAAIVGAIVLVASLAGGATTTTTTPSNPALFGVAIILLVISSLLAFIAWIGALVRTAQLGRLGWFVCLIIFSGVTMLLYIFVGPTTPANAAPAYSSPSGYR